MCVINYTRVKIIINICMISSLKPQDAWHTLSLSPNPSSSLSPVARLPTWRRMMMTTPVRLPHSCCLACFNHVCGCSPSLRPPLSLSLSFSRREASGESAKARQSDALHAFVPLVYPSFSHSFALSCSFPSTLVACSSLCSLDPSLSLSLLHLSPPEEC